MRRSLFSRSVHCFSSCSFDHMLGFSGLPVKGLKGTEKNPYSTLDPSVCLLVFAAAWVLTGVFSFISCVFFSALHFRSSRRAR